MDIPAWVRNHRVLTGIVVILLAMKVLSAIILPVLGVHTVVQHSGSMEPALQPGDLVLVTDTRFEAIKEGDIVLYHPEQVDTPIMHRVISRNATALQTQGDNNVDQIKFCVREDRNYPSNGDCPDGRLVNVENRVTADQVRGTAFIVVPKAGYILRPDAVL